MNKTKKNLYIVTSAISTQTGNIDLENRWTQTLHTVNSINVKDSNADIWLIDTGSNKLPEWTEKLWPSNVKIHWWCNAPNVERIRLEAIAASKQYGKHCEFKKEDGSIYKDIERGERHVFAAYIKNVTEQWAIMKVLELLKEDIEKDKYNLIHKLSGRYFLTELFDLDNFKEGDMFFQKQYENNNSVVMWAFKATQYDNFLSTWKQCGDWLANEWARPSVSDLESAVGFNFKNKEVVLIKPWGVMGIVNSSEGKKQIVTQ
jgi:hypothetical protein